MRMSKIMLDKRGAILTLVLLINSIMILIGTVLLSTASMDFKMKKLNSEVKKTLYHAEAGIDEAYVITLEFISSAIEYAISEEEKDYRIVFIDFIKGNCRDSIWEKNLTNVLEDNTKYEIYKDNYPSISAVLTEKEDYFDLMITSTYVKGNIKKIISMLCKISIPMDEIDFNNIKAEDLVEIIDWKVER